jgi:hypothetical protein
VARRDALKVVAVPGLYAMRKSGPLSRGGSAQLPLLCFPSHSKQFPPGENRFCEKNNGTSHCPAACECVSVSVSVSDVCVCA